MLLQLIRFKQLRLCRQLLSEKLLKGFTVLSELFDALMEFVKGHRVLEESPSELGLVVDEGNLGDGVGLCSCVEVSGGLATNDNTTHQLLSRAS